MAARGLGHYFAKFKAYGVAEWRDLLEADLADDATLASAELGFAPRDVSKLRGPALAAHRAPLDAAGPAEAPLGDAASRFEAHCVRMARPRTFFEEPEFQAVADVIGSELVVDVLVVQVGFLFYSFCCIFEFRQDALREERGQWEELA